MNKHGVFERCVALGDSSVLNERQIGWSGRWILMADFVVCSQCLVAQPIDMAEQSFTHSPGCVASRYGLYPWHELHQILRQLPSQYQIP